MDQEDTRQKTLVFTHVHMYYTHVHTHVHVHKYACTHTYTGMPTPCSTGEPSRGEDSNFVCLQRIS